MYVSGLAAQHFGLPCLHSWQSEIIEATLTGKDCLVVQPTGAGKSMCYVIPPVYKKKTAIVITPTISLMTDQVSKLLKRGIPAIFLGSAQTQDVMSQVQAGEFQVVYTTPETFYDKVTQKPRQEFVRLAHQGRLAVIAIDEAHLIFTWKSFR